MSNTGAYPGALRAVLTRASRKALEKDAALVTAKAVALAPKDTMELAESISYTVEGSTPETMTATIVVKAQHGIIVEKGSGIYGPKGRPIKPKRSKVMVFPGRAGIVYTKSVLGQKAQPFLSKALRSFKN